MESVVDWARSRDAVACHHHLPTARSMLRSACGLHRARGMGTLLLRACAGLKGLGFIPSFGTGSLIMGTVILILLRICQGPIKFACSQTLWAGLTSGCVWQFGNVCQVIAQSYYGLPYAIACERSATPLRSGAHPLRCAIARIPLSAHTRAHARSFCRMRLRILRVLKCDLRARRRAWCLRADSAAGTPPRLTPCARRVRVCCVPRSDLPGVDGLRRLPRHRRLQ